MELSLIEDVAREKSVEGGYLSVHCRKATRRKLQPLALDEVVSWKNVGPKNEQFDAKSIYSMESKSKMY